MSAERDAGLGFCSHCKTLMVQGCRQQSNRQPPIQRQAKTNKWRSFFRESVMAFSCPMRITQQGGPCEQTRKLRKGAPQLAHDSRLFIPTGRKKRLSCVWKVLPAVSHQNLGGMGPCDEQKPTSSTSAKTSRRGSGGTEPTDALLPYNTFSAYETIPQLDMHSLIRSAL